MNIKKRILVTCISTILSLLAIYIYKSHPEQFTYYCQTGFDICRLFDIASILSTFFSITVISLILIFAKNSVYKSWLIFTIFYLCLLSVAFFWPSQPNSVSAWSITGSALLILDSAIYIAPALIVIFVSYVFFVFMEKK
jgi:hypothetical protein